jgi:hypothetical protein
MGRDHDWAWLTADHPFRGGDVQAPWTSTIVGLSDVLIGVISSLCERQSDRGAGLADNTYCAPV